MIMLVEQKVYFAEAQRKVEGKESTIGVVIAPRFKETGGSVLLSFEDFDGTRYGEFRLGLEPLTVLANLLPKVADSEFKLEDFPLETFELNE
jgi:hypothetical protein